ncbi:MAG: hypothetical protein ACD_62C00241G0007 [uncultured bacterium]|nr:MAG: hypothetical protein ACD_62C00241G0007 [uncultured bacterium]
MPTPQQAMEYIWNKIPKQDDGTIRYQPGDLDYLYNNGFVNSRKYSREQWKSAFRAYARPDGTYRIKKNQFIALCVFREVSPLKIFDASKIKDGPWTDEELRTLYHEAIVPSSELRPESFTVFVDTLKEHGKVDAKGLLVLDEASKKALQELVETYPSPRVQLDREIKRIKNAQEKELIGNQVYRDRSGFSVGEKINETTTASLQHLEGIKSSLPPATSEPIPEKSFDIKNLRKPKGKVFG